MRKLSSYIGRYWYGYVFAVASMVTAIALDMLYPKITQKIVDDVILGGQMEILTKLLESCSLDSDEAFLVIVRSLRLIFCPRKSGQRCGKIYLTTFRPCPCGILTIPIQEN